ncbi:tyrosine-type recombinase/integrase [Ruegeria arenilitoris]|uniref:tyrosine-type recombinase/integrase n=1 Tax=Ruegeria arenilitoris TaxID=1173585 RepID=UPI00147C34E3|nr:tyrosine-type recombinase/integrase [Ruegeria arenilitoris]
MKIKHVEWRGGRANYRRRIPEELQHHYNGSRYYFVSLGTKDPAEAAKKSQQVTAQLDREWRLLRSNEGGDLALLEQGRAILRKYGLEPGQGAVYEANGLEPDAFVNTLIHESRDEDGYAPGFVKERLPADLRTAAELFYAAPEKVDTLIAPYFSEVKDQHLYFHPKRAADSQFDRSVERFVEINGDLPINRYHRQHGNDFVRELLKTVKPATVKRYLNQIRPIFNTAIRELNVRMENPLSGLIIPSQDTEWEPSRLPFSLEQVWAIQQRCIEVDDERRWVIATLSDTGARMSEVVGLLRKDVCLEAPISHIKISPNQIRSLKTKASLRTIPLVGVSLWAVRRAVNATESDCLFPGLIKNGDFNKNSVSATLNKWLKEQGLREHKQSLHSLRHSLRDRLRNTNCPPDVIDRIGGWKRDGVGEGYGLGHDLSVLNGYLGQMLKAEAVWGKKCHLLSEV